MIVLRKFFLFLACVLAIAVTIASCGDDNETIAPKPRGYFRLSFPEKKYVRYDSACPFTYEMPVYAKMVPDMTPGAQPCWLNMIFPHFHATLHLSYRPVTGNLQGFLDDTYTLASKHQVKASGIREQLIENDSVKVYGLLYDIEGNAASSVQFYLTDSAGNFLRGALYFNAVPNTDSLKPVVDFLRTDIYRMIQTFRWKKSDIIFPDAKATIKRTEEHK